MDHRLLYSYTAVFSIFGSWLHVILNGESIFVKLLCLLFWFTTSLFACLFHDTFRKLKNKTDPL